MSLSFARGLVGMVARFWRESVQIKLKMEDGLRTLYVKVKYKCNLLRIVDTLKSSTYPVDF